MLIALSRRYFGVAISAQDPAINYASYKHLGLYCPFCKAPVFFVVGSQRKPHSRQTKKGKTTVKASTVQSHFAHFGEGEDNYPQACEIRSKRLKRQQIAEFNGQARDQRLKNLWVHFDRLLALSVSPGGSRPAPVNQYQQYCTDILGIENASAIVATTEKYLRSSTKEFKQKCDDLLDNLIVRAGNPLTSVGLVLSDPEFFDSPPKELSNMDVWLLQIVPDAQKTLIEEAIDFLLFNRNQLLLEEQIFIILYSVIAGVGRRIEEARVSLPTSFLIQETIGTLVTSLTLCRWAENFAKLEKKDGFS